MIDSHGSQPILEPKPQEPTSRMENKRRLFFGSRCSIVGRDSQMFNDLGLNENDTKHGFACLRMEHSSPLQISEPAFTKYR
jgi:hypothetical protein